MRAAIGDRERAAIGEHGDGDRSTAMLRGRDLPRRRVTEGLRHRRPQRVPGPVASGVRGVASALELAEIDEREELTGDRVHREHDRQGP